MTKQKKTKSIPVDDRLGWAFNLPERIQSEYDNKAVCMHYDEYSPHDEQLSKEDFLCPSCGDSPIYIVCDRNTDRPTKHKVEYLQELDKAEHYSSVLCQGS